QSGPGERSAPDLRGCSGLPVCAPGRSAEAVDGVVPEPLAIECGVGVLGLSATDCRKRGLVNLVFTGLNADQKDLAQARAFAPGADALLVQFLAALDDFLA